MKKLIIIPAYNEEESIVKVVESIRVDAADFDYIIVNDGSTDGTLRVCRQNNFNVINLPINLGIGGCMQTGYKYALKSGYDYAVQFDGDGQHNSKEINKLFDTIKREKANLVIGSRFIQKDGFQSTLTRRIGILYFSRLIRILTDITVTDPTSGFRICDREVISYFASNYPKDFPEPESIILAVKNGFKITETDTKMVQRQRGVSSINMFKSIYYMVKVTLAILISFSKTYKKDIFREC